MSHTDVGHAFAVVDLVLCAARFLIGSACLGWFAWTMWTRCRGINNSIFKA